MDFALDAEQQAIVDTVRAFVERELYPHEDEVERLGDVPDELADHVRGEALRSGLYAPNMPADLGGGGLDGVGLALAERELGRASYALQWLVGRPSNILLGCTGDQVERYLLPAVRGERLDCLAMTEPDAGSDVRSMATRAVRDGDDWVLSGTKHFISYADKADFVILFAATGVEQGSRAERKLISGFLLDKGTPGMQVRLDAPTVSHRGYHHCEIVLTDCRLPAGQLLGEEGGGFELMGRWLGSTRLSVAATCVGRARRVLEATVEWAATRRQFGRPVGQFQGTGFKLADMAVELDAAELLMLRAAWLHDQGRMTDADVAAAKLYASEMLGRVTDHAVQVFGGMGLSSLLPVERWWRDARVERIWDGTSEIQRHIVSRALLRAHGA
jgi:acyl-CoA dehydrogenase